MHNFLTALPSPLSFDLDAVFREIVTGKIQRTSSLSRSLDHFLKEINQGLVEEQTVEDPDPLGLNDLARGMEYLHKEAQLRKQKAQARRRS